MVRATPFETTNVGDDLARAQSAPMSDVAFERLTLAQSDRQWELRQGWLREKPGMTWDHNNVAYTLGFFLGAQLDWSEFRVRVNASHLYRPEATYYIPDVLVVPVELGRSLRGRPNKLEAFTDPLPLVVEIWSPSTGDSDVDAKLPAYQARCDLEIWRVPPYERMITAWRRQPDGSYAESIHREGRIAVASLPGVEIELAALFID